MFNDKLGEECGIFGGYCKSSNIAPFIKTGLFKLQHRGQESAGICSGAQFQTLYKDKGLVTDVFDEKSMQKLTGKFGIGHVRYSTQGESNAINAQPYLLDYFGGQISIAHNGNIKEASEIREELEKSGVIFITKSDSEVLLKKILFEIKKYLTEFQENLIFDAIGTCLNQNFSQGAYSAIFYLANKVLAYRDPFGYRPLFFCEAEEGYFVASENVAFNELNIIKIIEIQAGWGVEINSNNYEIKPYAKVVEEQKCVFEHIYFSHPDSNTFGLSVYESRIALGKLLAKNDSIGENIKAHIVVPVMDSGFISAVGYSKESGVPLEIGLLTNPWVGRSFIEPTQELRTIKVKEKFSAIKAIVDGKKVILIDDSIVRGTTAIETVKMLKNAGAKEIHFRLASPMILNTCSWGVDIPTKEELIANTYKTQEQIARYIGADSVKYLPMEMLQEYFGQGWCYNCLMTNVGVEGCTQHTKIAALI